LKAMRFTRVLAFVAIGAVVIPFASMRAHAEDGGEVEVHRTSIDINHSGGTEPGDQADISVVVKDVQNPATCNSNDDVVKGGVKLSLHSGGCTGSSDASVTIPSFRPISGTNTALFEGETAEGETADAVVHRKSTPDGSCGKWKVKVDVSSIDLSRVTSNPIGLSVELPDGSSRCVEVDNAAIDR
jgi:hypothetical protein